MSPRQQKKRGSGQLSFYIMSLLNQYRWQTKMFLVQSDEWIDFFLFFLPPLVTYTLQIIYLIKDKVKNLMHPICFKIETVSILTRKRTKCSICPKLILWWHRSITYVTNLRSIFGALMRFESKPFNENEQNSFNMLHLPKQRSPKFYLLK